MYIRLLPELEACIVKLPIRLIPGSAPPKFEFCQTVAAIGGQKQLVKHRACAPPAMETALIDLLRVAQQLAEENARLKLKVK